MAEEGSAAVEQAKQEVLRAMDARREEIGNFSEQILREAELGFREFNTAEIVKRAFDRLGIPYQSELAITGVKGVLKGGAGDGPNVAVLGELDALPIPNHPAANPANGASHACGHNAQLAMMLGVAMALKDSGVIDRLSGAVVLFAVPAEELVDFGYRLGLRKEGKIRYLTGKAELIRVGAFDDVQMSLMAHNTAKPEGMKLGIRTTMNGCVMKTVTFLGRGAHAGSFPHLGINALNAAELALAAIHAQRETFREDDCVRVHWIISKGGTAVNVVPSEVQVDMFVRARTAEAISEANRKVDRALRAGAMAIGAKVSIHTLPGYMPILPYTSLDDLFGANGEQLLGKGGVTKLTHKTGSTDLGDLSCIMPAIHPFAGGARGSNHDPDWHVGDLDTAVMTPAKALAMTVVDLLHDGARGARAVLEDTKPPMTREQYLTYLESLDREELYSPE